MMIHGGGWLVSKKDDYVLTAAPYLVIGSTSIWRK